MTIEMYEFNHDVHVIGFQVMDFPTGIPAAFAKLIEIISLGPLRGIFSISRPQGNGIHYVAGMEMNSPSDSIPQGFHIYTIPQGKYISTTLMDWKSKLGAIQGIFGALTQDPRIDPEGFCVEWYKNEEELVCLVSTPKEL